MVANFKKNKNQKKGQATFEFLIFLPFLLIFIGIFATISGSINGAINQEKATRGYFYRILKGNPYIVTRGDAGGLVPAFGNSLSSLTIGFRKKSEQESSIMSCYAIKSFLAGTIEEKCDAKSDNPGGPTFLIKVGTMYGACGGSYYASGPRGELALSFESAANGSCGLQ